MRRGIATLAAIGAASMCAAALAQDPSAAGPPAETTDRLAAAIAATVPEGFRGSYTMRTLSVVSKPSGKNREEESEVERVTIRADGARESVIVSATENGKDVTEQRRREEEQRAQARRQREAAGATAGDTRAKRDTDDSGFRLPAGEDRKIYAFSAPAEAEGLLVAAFAPLAQHRKDEMAMKGRLAWHPDTLAPAWIELSFADPPTGLPEFLMRFELAPLGDALYVRRMMTDGVGGLLFIKRRFHAEVEVTEILPDPVPAP